MKKYLAFGLIIAMILVGVGVIKAQTTGTTSTSTATTSTSTTATTITSTVPSSNLLRSLQIVNISSNGTALVRGTVESVSGNVVHVRGWGGVWRITVSPDTLLNPLALREANPATTSTSTQNLRGIRVGDVVGALGSMDQSRDFTVNARFLRDWTLSF